MIIKLLALAAVICGIYLAVTRIVPSPPAGPAGTCADPIYGAKVRDPAGTPEYVGGSTPVQYICRDGRWVRTQVTLRQGG